MALLPSLEPVLPHPYHVEIVHTAEDAESQLTRYRNAGYRMTAMSSHSASPKGLNIVFVFERI